MPISIRYAHANRIKLIQAVNVCVLLIILGMALIAIAINLSLSMIMADAIVDNTLLLMMGYANVIRIL